MNINNWGNRQTIKRGSDKESELKERVQDHNRQIIQAKKIKAKEGWRIDNFVIIAQAFVEVLHGANIGEFDKGRKVDPRPLFFSVMLAQVMPDEGKGIQVLPGLYGVMSGRGYREDGAKAFELTIPMIDAAEFLKIAIPQYTGKPLDGDIWELSSVPK